jgi:hypothetical protein
VVGGELIDISIPTKDDFSLLQFYKHQPIGIHRYTLRDGDGHDAPSLRFFGYSVEHLITDLEKIVFGDTKYPWTAEKYTKRINRLMFYYFIDMLDKPLHNTDRIQIFGALEKTAVACSRKKRNSKQLPNFCKSKKAPRICMLFKVVLEQLRPVHDTAEFKDFVKVLSENIAVLKPSLVGLADFCADKQVIRFADLYDDAIDKLV